MTSCFRSLKTSSIASETASTSRPRVPRPMITAINSRAVSAFAPFLINFSRGRSRSGISAIRLAATIKTCAVWTSTFFYVFGSDVGERKRYKSRPAPVVCMSTMDNVGAAFAGESQANRKDLAFSEKAAQEGFPAVAKSFRAASEDELSTPGPCSV